MDSVGQAALESWAWHPWTTAVLSFAAVVYISGWIRIRRLVRTEQDGTRLACFLAGLCVVFLARSSPLDAFDKLLLSAHMTQHLLLLSIAPPLLLLGRPVIPVLRGLPKTFVKEALGPFLTSPVCHRISDWLTSMPVAWILFALSTIVWHLPPAYELALRSNFFHDFQHACFFWTGIVFWIPLIQQGPGKSRWPAWAPIPYLLFADLVNTVLSASFVFAGRVLYASYESVRLGSISPLTDQTLAGAIMWVPGSIVYLIPAIVFAMRVFSPERPTASNLVLRLRNDRRMSRTLSLPARWLVRARRLAQWTMLVVAVVVVVDGFRGTQLAPLNLAGVLPWIHWRALSVGALLVVGNLFCMSCPFTLVRDGARRIIAPRLRWPKVLRSKWLPVALLILYFWTYEAFSLWASPSLTAWIIVAYFACSLAIDTLFRGASFCKYVCPIGQFHFITSLVSPREVTVRKQSVCGSCRTHDCIRGNETARGCELYLFQPKKASNLDCTFCLDCVNACPHDNVALLPVLPAKTLTEDPYRSSVGRLSNRNDFAALALLIVFAAFVNAAGMTGPVMMYEHEWHAQLGPHAMPLVVGIFVLLGAILAPVVLVSLSTACNRLVIGGDRVLGLCRRLIYALVPLGISMWAAHLLYHFVTAWTSLLSFITPLQILCLDAGLLLTLYVILRIAEQYGSRMRQIVGLAAPWAILSLGLYAAGIWILFQPMEMRGMTH
ncbi:MAG: cytochrome c oxidase assembly protein [Bryobacteraceae bacterium]